MSSRNTTIVVLTCDRSGCRSRVRGEPGDNVQKVRDLAQRVYGWSTVTEQGSLFTAVMDFCCVHTEGEEHDDATTTG